MRIWLAKRLRRLAARLDPRDGEAHIFLLLDELDSECEEHAKRIHDLHNSVRIMAWHFNGEASGRSWCWDGGA